MTTDNSLQLATCKNYVVFPSCNELSVVMKIIEIEKNNKNNYFV
jgi:hypothetical protein